MPASSDPLDGRLGLNVPYEWWPTSPMLKEIEASGFSWVQIPSPPQRVLADARGCLHHARGLAAALATTGLRSVLHAPTDLLVGTPHADRVFEGALAYAAETDAEQVVYHARAVVEGPGSDRLLAAEARSLAVLARRAERLGVVIALENLAPVYPGPETLSATPQALRSLARRLDSPAVRLCLDLGHANVIAGLRRTSLAALVEPALDTVSLFHVHDNLGGRWNEPVKRPEIDPLRLDLHLPPGRGTLDWHSMRDDLRSHFAPLLLEVHPPLRASPAELARLERAALAAPDTAHAF